MDKSLHAYLNAVADLTRRGDAREESYYPALTTLLETLAQTQNRAVKVTVLPKPTEAGNPDFRVWDGSQRVIGYIEAKAPDAKLDQIETSEQLQRYRHTFPNLILTNFYEFRLYRHAELLERVQLARPFIPQVLKTRPPAEQVNDLLHLLDTFFSFALPPSLTAEELARQLARRTRFLRDQVIRPELEQQSGSLFGFFQAFQKYLIAGLTPDQFADLYAQTIAYGLFAARTRAANGFNRQTAFSLIPATIGILRDVFQFISLGRSSAQMETIVDEIAAVLNVADLRAILTQYNRQGKGNDPVLHFYETFLAEYDPETRERRGVYYTPQPVVRFIVRAVHDLLQTRFGLPDGLADERVTLLDPAAGTLTFPAEAVRLAFEHFSTKYGEGGKEILLRRHILPHFYAFELLMAPYAIGHMKIGYLLESLGVPLQEGERFRFFLTNTLEMEDLQQIAIPGLASLSEESHQAAQIKKNEPILVILGNPPYSGISANANPWTEKLLKSDLDGAPSYYTVDGQPLGEKNPKWLQDDYVKFLRFAQWKIHKAGQGILAMITNHSYLDNPTFRGMRRSLLHTFDEIYLLDLHGSSLKRESAPDGSADENVFDIRQGVAIGVFVKQAQGSGRAQVRHAELLGRREEKYARLQAWTLAEAGWQALNPEPPFYFFVPRQTQNLQAYQSWPSVTEVFPLHSVGIVTARDNLTIRWTAEEMWTTVLTFSQLSEELARQTYQLGKDARDWKVSLAQQDVRRDGGPHREKIVPILYRPFDVRYTYYTGRSRGFLCMPRAEVMRHMLAGENLGLVVSRQVKAGETWQHSLVFSQIIESSIISNRTSEIGYCFPLYLYPSEESPQLFEKEPRPNLAAWLTPVLEAAYGFTPTPEEALAYIYAVLYSPTYRTKYAAELRTDFPRLPFTANPDLFLRLAGLGRRLIDLHLLRSPGEGAAVKYQGKGSDLIEKVRYDPNSGRVQINAEKYFEGITPQMWAYRIGGYAVLEKYLKDRKGRRLDDPLRYIRIAAAIAETIRIQQELDGLYPAVEGSPLAFEHGTA